MNRVLAFCMIVLGGALLALVLAIPGDQLVPAFCGGALIGVGVLGVLPRG